MFIANGDDDTPHCQFIGLSTVTIGCLCCDISYNTVCDTLMYVLLLSRAGDGNGILEDVVGVSCYWGEMSLPLLDCNSSAHAILCPLHPPTISYSQYCRMLF